MATHDPREYNETIRCSALIDILFLTFYFQFTSRGKSILQIEQARMIMENEEDKELTNEIIDFYYNEFCSLIYQTEWNYIEDARTSNRIIKQLIECISEN